MVYKQGENATSSSFNFHALAGLGPRRFSLPDITRRAPRRPEQSRSDLTGYDADSEAENQPRNRKPSTRSLPPSLHDIAMSARAADQMAIHVDFALALTRSTGRRARTAPHTPRNMPPTRSRAPARHSQENLIQPLSGLGLGLPTTHHIHADRSAVAEPDSTTSQLSDPEQPLRAYPLLPPGLSNTDFPHGTQSPHHLYPDTSSSSSNSETDNDLEDYSDIIIDIVRPTPLSSHSSASEYPFYGDMSPPGAPRLESICRFETEPLYH